MTWGHVYESTTTSYIRRSWRKIGVTKNVIKRIAKFNASTSQPEEFISFNWFRFENMSIASEVEKEVHKTLTALGWRVNDRREFFEYEPNFFLRDLIYSISEREGYRVLSNFNIGSDAKTELDIMLPCRYFLLNDEEIFQDFCNWGSRTLNTALRLRWHFEDDYFYGPMWHKLFEKPDFPFLDYLRDFDKMPYILARMYGDNNPKIKKLSEALFNEYSEELNDFFSFDSAKITALTARINEP